MKRIWVLFSAIVSLSSLVTMAADPIGAPRASMGQGKWGLSLEYSYTQMNLMRDTSSWQPGGYKIDDMQTAFLTGSYGVTNWMDMFVRIGLADLSSTDKERERIHHRRVTVTNDYDYDPDLIYGAGARFTFGHTGDVTYGAVVTYSWANLDGDYSSSYVRHGHTSELDGGSMEMDMQQLQVALGATWNISERFAVYGGGLLHYVRIVEDRTTQHHHHSHTETEVIKNDDGASMLGGYVGLEVGIIDNLVLSVEGSYTGDTKGGSASLGWKF